MTSKNVPAKADEGFDFCSFLAPLAPLFSLIEEIFLFFGVEINILDILGCDDDQAEAS